MHSRLPEQDKSTTSVFLGGSRKLSRLNQQIRSRLKMLTKRHLKVLIGDANGADKAIQTLLADEGYRNVMVFCMGENCRNNVGKWPVVTLESPQYSKGFDYFIIKDAEMSRRANYGFMLWDGRSRGTLNNVLNLLQQKKLVFVYFAPKKEFRTIESMEELHHFVNAQDAQTRKLYSNLLQYRHTKSLTQGRLELQTNR